MLLENEQGQQRQQVSNLSEEEKIGRRAAGKAYKELPFFTFEPVLYPYTAERRDVLENTLPEAQEISQGWGFCTPRPERLPEGEARGQSRGPRGAKSPHEGNLEGRGGCIFQCIPTRVRDSVQVVAKKHLI